MSFFSFFIKPSAFTLLLHCVQYFPHNEKTKPNKYRRWHNNHNYSPCWKRTRTFLNIIYTFNLFSTFCLFVLDFCFFLYKFLTLFLLVFDSFIVENVVGENECTIVGEIVKLTNFVIRVGLDAINFGELDITFVTFWFQQGLLARAKHFALNTVLVVLTR